MDECDSLENCWGCKPLVGSNPTRSAKVISQSIGNIKNFQLGPLWVELISFGSSWINHGGYSPILKSDGQNNAKGDYLGGLVLGQRFSQWFSREQFTCMRSSLLATERWNFPIAQFYKLLPLRRTFSSHVKGHRIELLLKEPRRRWPFSAFRASIARRTPYELEVQEVSRELLTEMLVVFEGSALPLLATKILLL